MQQAYKQLPDGFDFKIANHRSLRTLIISNIYLPLISNIFLIINLIIIDWSLEVILISKYF